MVDLKPEPSKVRKERKARVPPNRKTSEQRLADLAALVKAQQIDRMKKQKKLGSKKSQKEKGSSASDISFKTGISDWKKI